MPRRGPQVTNSADVDWTSLPGTPDEERDGADGPGGFLDDHAATDSVSFTTDEAELAKELVATSASHTADTDVAVGEVVTYRLTVTLPEGVTPSITVTDTLPDGIDLRGGLRERRRERSQRVASRARGVDQRPGRDPSPSEPRPWSMTTIRPTTSSRSS